MTENEKAKFQNPFTYNDQRNFVERNPVKEISDDLVYLTKDTSSASILSELEEREEIAEDVPAPVQVHNEKVEYSNSIACSIQTPCDFNYILQNKNSIVNT